MKHIRKIAGAGAAILLVTTSAVAWGAHGHGLAARAAAAGLPADMPAFFTGAADQLAYLNPEPDRWRDDALAPMNEAWRYDHYIDLENVPEGALEAPDRFTFINALYQADVSDPHQTVGFLPYRILELYQRLATEFALWRRAETDRERRWIEARVINDAGVLGHYIADAANPHHTTIHFNGWAADAPNPAGYTTSRDFHWRFESLFVEAHVTAEDVLAVAPAGATAVPDARAAIMDFLRATHGQVVPLYELERDVGFDPEDGAPEAVSFAVRRLAAGASMLRTLWYSAWVESEAIAARASG